MPPQVGIGHPQKIEAAHDSCKSPNDSGLAKEGQSPKSNHPTLGHYVTHRAPPPAALRILLISCQQDTHWFVVATLVASPPPGRLKHHRLGAKNGAQAHPTNSKNPYT